MSDWWESDPLVEDKPAQATEDFWANDPVVESAPAPAPRTASSMMEATANAITRGGLGLRSNFNTMAAESLEGLSTDSGRSLGEIVEDSDDTTADYKPYNPRAAGSGVKTGSKDYLPEVEGLYRWATSRLANMAGYGAEELHNSAENRMKLALEDRVAASKLPRSAAAQRFVDAKQRGEISGATDILQYGWNDPASVLAMGVETSIESSPSMVAGIGAGILTRNPGAAATVMGGSSYFQERYGSTLDFLADNGVDLSNPEAAKSVISNRELMAKADEYGIKRGAIVAAFDTVSGIFAAGELFKGPVKNFASQMAGQAVLGGSGEAAAQKATTGKVDWSDVALEALAEFTTAPIEVVGVGRQYLNEKGKSTSELNVEEVLGDVIAGKPGAREALVAYGMTAEQIDDMVSRRKATDGSTIEQTTEAGANAAETAAINATQDQQTPKASAVIERARQIAEQRAAAAPTAESNSAAPAQPPAAEQTQPVVSPTTEAATEPPEAGVEANPAAPTSPTEQPAAEAPAEAEVPPPSRANFYADSPETIKFQHSALLDPKNDRKVVMYSSEMKLGELPDKPKPAYIKRYQFKVDGKTTYFDVNTAKTNYGEVQKAVRTGKLNELLDLGPYDMQQVAASAATGAPSTAAVERTPDGTEVKAAAGTIETVPEQVTALEQTKSAPENTVTVENPETVIAERQQGNLPATEEDNIEVDWSTLTPEQIKAAANLKEKKPKYVLYPGEVGKRRMLTLSEAEDLDLSGLTDVEKYRIMEESGIDMSPDEAAELPSGEAKKGKNWGKERERRAEIQQKASEVTAEFTPQSNEDGFLNRGSVGPRDAILARARAMVARAEEAGISIVERFKDAKDESMRWGADMVLLNEARKLAGKNKPQLKDYTRFVTREKALRAGQVKEVKQERKVEADSVMRRDTVDVETVGDAGAVKSAPAQRDPLFDNERAAQVAPVKSMTKEERERIEAKLRERRLMRVNGQTSPQDETVLPLDENDVVERYSLTEAIGMTADLGEVSDVSRKIISQILDRVSERIGKVPVKFVHQETLDAMYPDREPGNVNGFYDPEKGHIVLSTDFLKSGEIDARLLAHEAVHAYLQDAVDRHPALKKDIIEIRDYVRSQSKVKDLYGFKDAHEFLSEALSNPDFQKLLMNTQVPMRLAKKFDLGPDGSLWDGLMSVIADFLGIGRRGLDALTYTLRLAERAEDRRNQGEAELKAELKAELASMNLLSEGRQKQGMAAITAAGKDLADGRITEEEYDAVVDKVVKALDRKPASKPTEYARRTQAKRSQAAMENIVSMRLEEKYQRLARFQKDLADTLSGKIRDKKPRNLKAPNPSDPDYEAKLERWMAQQGRNAAIEPVTPPAQIERAIKDLSKSIEKDEAQLADIRGGNNRVQKPVTKRLLSEGRQKRDYKAELTAAGVPDETAAQLEAFIDEELGKAIEPSTLPLLMGDLIREFGSTSGSNTPPTPPVPPVAPGAAAAPATPTPSFKEGARRSAMRGIALKVNTLDYIRQTYNKYFNGLLDRYVKVIQKYDAIAGDVAEKHDRDGAELLELMRRDPKEGRALAELAMDATRMNVQLGPNGKNTHLGKGSKRGHQARQRLAALNARYNQLKPESRALYQRMVKNYRDTHNENIRALAYNLLVSLELNNRLSNSDLMMLLDKVVEGTLTKEDAAIIGEPKIYKELKRATALRTIQGDYFPQMRFGNFVVLSNDKIANPNIKHVTSGSRRFPVTTSVKGNVVTFRMDSSVSGGKAALNRAVMKYIEQSDLTLLRATKAFVDKKTGKVTKPGDMDFTKDYDMVWNLEFQTRGVNFFETASEAQKFRNSLARNSADLDELSPVLDRRVDNDKLEKLISGSALSEVTKRIDKRSDLKDWQKKQMHAAVKEAIISQMSGNRAQKRHQARRNVKGASNDIARAAVTYGQSAGNYYAMLSTANELQESFNAIEDYNSQNEGKEDAGARSQVINELRLRQATLNDPLYVNKWFQHAATLSFLDKLFGPSHSIINFAQVVGNTLPYLGGKYGNIDAATAVSKAYSKIGVGDVIAGGLKNTATAMTQWQKSWLDTGDLVGSVKKKLGPEYEALIDELVERGILEPNSGFEIGSAVTAGNDKFSTGLAKLDRAARQLPGAVEIINRTVAAVAAYDLAMAAKKTRPEAINEAYNTVSMTQGDYRGSNNPRFMRMKGLSFALQFKKYAVMQTQLIGDIYARAVKGATPQERAIAQKQLVNMIAMQTVIAGSLGLPGLEVIKLGLMLLSVLFPELGWDDLEEKYKQLLDDSIGVKASELIRNGVITRAIGIDVSSRMSQADLWTNFVPTQLDKNTIPQYFGQLLMGAPGSNIMEWSEGLKALKDGDVLTAVQKIIPIKFAADTITAVKGYRDGKYNLPEAVGKGLGFSTAREARAMEKNQIERANKGEVDAERSKLYRAYINARSKSDLARIKARIREFNRSRGKNERKLSLPALERKRREEMKAYSE